MQEDQRGLLPILGPLLRWGNLCHDRVSLALCPDRVFKPGAQPDLGARDRLVRAVGMHARQRSAGVRQSFLALCCDKVPRHTGRFRS